MVKPLYVYIKVLKSEYVLNRIESRSFPVKISCAVTGTSRKAFPVIGMMCDLKTFSHASEEYRMAAWNITCTERMIADCSRFTWRFSLASVDGNVA